MPTLFSGMNGSCSLTVMFEMPFWVGIYERRDKNKYEVCKITFGAEPKDYEVYAFLLANYNKLSFSPAVRSDNVTERTVNPKRIQREISATLHSTGIGTKAQQSLKMLQEQNKTERRQVSREKREAEKNRRFELRQEKKKEKHRGR